MYPKEKIDESWEKVLLNQCTFIRLILFMEGSLIFIQSTTVTLASFVAEITKLTNVQLQVLPGSSMCVGLRLRHRYRSDHTNTNSGMVYDDAEVLYAEVKKDGEAMLEEAFSVLFPNSVPLTPSTRSKSMAGSSKIVGYNTTFFPRWDIVKIPLAKAGGPLKSLVLQASDNGKEGYAIMHCASGGAAGELKHPSNALHASLKPVSGVAFFF